VAARRIRTDHLRRHLAAEPDLDDRDAGDPGGRPGAVAVPLVDALQRRGVPRAAGAALILLGLVAIAKLVVFLAVHGISANSSDASAQASTALEKIER
jgi:hypothetical protein